MIGWTKEQGVKIGLFDGLGREGKVPVVNGIKGTAEETDLRQ
jgi:hypothetical protein